MSNEEKRALIDSAETVEEVEEKVQEIEQAEASKEEPVEEVKEESTNISKEEERKLIKESAAEVEERAAIELRKIERKDEPKMEEELRNSKKYIDAYAEYIKTGDEKELRALVSIDGNATGNSATVEVPDMVYDIVKTAWEREDLMSRVRTLSVKGNLKVQFEVSGSAAVEHQEGSGAVTEESLVLGVVELKPVSIKKWISISDEVIDMRGEAFLRYIYDELTYRIAKKCADLLVAKIAALPATLTANTDGVYDEVSANKITKAPAIGTIAEAIANLNDETKNITIVMNKLTFADFKNAQYSAQYAADIFEGATVVFNNTLPAYSAASAGAVYALVGDFDIGALANYPNGEGIDIKYDDTTLMTSDLVRILGRRYVAAEPVQDKAFCLIAKPSQL